MAAGSVRAERGEAPDAAPFGPSLPTPVRVRRVHGFPLPFGLSLSKPVRASPFGLSLSKPLLACDVRCGPEGSALPGFVAPLPGRAPCRSG